jgi:WD40 repeat protein
LVATACDDKTVNVWDASTGLRRATFTDHTAPVRCVAFSPSGQTVASASADRAVRIWDLESGTLKQTLPDYEGVVQSVCFTPDGERVIAADSSGAVRITDVTTGRLLVTLIELPREKGGKSSHDWIAFTPNGTYACSDGARQWIRWRVGDTLTADDPRGVYRKSEAIEKALGGKKEATS